MKNKPEYIYSAQDGYLSFSNGELCISTYSYQIDSWGEDELSKEQTRLLYEKMKEYYEEQTPNS